MTQPLYRVQIEGQVVIPCPYNVYEGVHGVGTFGYYAPDEDVLRTHLREQHPGSPYLASAEPCGALMGLYVLAGGIGLLLGAGLALAVWGARSRE